MFQIRIIALLIFCFWVSKGFGQNDANSNSFEKLKKQTEEIAKMKPDSASDYADRLLKMAKAMKSEPMYAEALSTMADVRIRQSLPDLADSLNKLALDINLKQKNRPGIALNYSQFGTTSQNKADYVSATEFFNKSLEFADKNAQINLISYNYRCLSKINSIERNLEKSLFFAKKAIENKAKLAPVEVGLGLLTLADYFRDNNKIDSANRYYNEAYNIFDKNKIEHSKAWVLSLWALIFAEKNWIKTLEMMLDAQSIFDKIAPESVFSANNIGNLGEVLFIVAQNDSLVKSITNKGLPKTKPALLAASEKYFQRAIDYSQKSENAYTYLYMSGNLADLQAYNGDYKNAFKNLQNKYKYNDSLFSQKNKNAIAKLESEKEVLNLNAINKQKTTNNKILIGLFSGLSLLTFLGYRNFKNRQKIQGLKITELEKDKQLLAVDAMLKGQEDERNRIAKDLHDGLGGMLSGVKMSFTNMKENMIMTAENVTVFEQSIGQLDGTIAELRKIAHNLMPEALVKFGLSDAINDFCNSLTQATHIHITYEHFGENRKLDNTANTYIYRIIQELINNAVKHGKPTSILVQMTTTPTKILLTVEDNGVGLEANKMASSKGIGIANIKHRVNYFKGSLDFENNIPKGTVVNIELTV